MRNFLILLAIMIIASAFHNGAPVPREKHRVRTIVRYLPQGGTDTTEYFYNTDGRISYTQNRGSGAFGSSYHYLPGMILRKYRDVRLSKNYTDTMILDANGRVKRLTSNNRGISFLRSQYNAEGQLTTSSWDFDSTGVPTYYTSYTYQNANRVSVKSFDAAGNTTSVATSQFYTDRLNTTGNENLGMDFAGVDSKNPETYSSSALSGQPPYNYVCNYHYDEKGRIAIKAKYNLNSGRMIDSFAYTYYAGVRLVVDGK